MSSFILTFTPHPPHDITHPPCMIYRLNTDVLHTREATLWSLRLFKGRPNCKWLKLSLKVKVWIWLLLQSPHNPRYTHFYPYVFFSALQHLTEGQKSTKLELNRWSLCMGLTWNCKSDFCVKSLRMYVSRCPHKGRSPRMCFCVFVPAEENAAASTDVAEKPW